MAPESENNLRLQIGHVLFIRVDPMLDDLRGHPRFEALAEKILPGREFEATSK